MKHSTQPFGHRSPVSRVLPLAALAMALLPSCVGFKLHRAPARDGSTAPPGDAADLQPPADPNAAAAESAASYAALTAAQQSTTNYASIAPNTRSAQCGAVDQRPCFIWEGIPSCNAGLVENLLAHRCVSAGPDGALASNARAVARDAADLLAALGGYITCFDPKLLQAAVDHSDAAYAKELQDSSCMRRMGAMAAARGYQTVTVGISGGGSFIVGSFVETGFAFDTDDKRAPTLYQTKAISIGFQAGAGVGINIGLSKGSNAVNTKGVDSQGFSFEAGAGAGAGTAIWYDYDGKLDGVSVSAIAGASGKAGAYNRITTSYYDPQGNNPMVCGAADQRACKLWERTPSCNKGLYEDLLQGMCRKPAPPKKLACGAKNQRPCKLWERIPSCDRGLAENFFAGKCQ